MRIDIHNYEAYMLDYLDGNLDEAMIKEMEAFLLMHPHIAEGLEDLDEIQLSVEDEKHLENTFLHQLKKKQIIASESINDNNYQDFFIAYWEGDLNGMEESNLQAFLAQNDQLIPEYKELGAIKLNPPTEIYYPEKPSLKKKNNKVIALWSVASSVAALLLLSFWIFSPSAQREHYSYESIAPRYLSSLQINKRVNTLIDPDIDMKPHIVFEENTIIILERMEIPEMMSPRLEQLAQENNQWQGELLMIQSLAFDRNQMNSQVDWASLPGDKNRGSFKLISSILWKTTKGQVKNMSNDLIQEDVKLFGSNNIEELTGGIISVKRPVKEVE